MAKLPLSDWLFPLTNWQTITQALHQRGITIMPGSGSCPFTMPDKPPLFKLTGAWCVYDELRLTEEQVRRLLEDAGFSVKSPPSD